MLKKLGLSLVVGLFLSTPVFAQGAANGIFVNNGAVDIMTGSADQLAGENHTGTGPEMKSLTSANSSVTITPSANVLDLSVTPRTVITSSSTGTVTLAVNTLNLLSGSGATADFPDPTTFKGSSIIVVNTGSGNITLTPASGTINDASTVTLATHTAAIVYSDNTNLHALTGIAAQ